MDDCRICSRPTILTACFDSYCARMCGVGLFDGITVTIMPLMHIGLQTFKFRLGAFDAL